MSNSKTQAECAPPSVHSSISFFRDACERMKDLSHDVHSSALHGRILATALDPNSYAVSRNSVDKPVSSSRMHFTLCSSYKCTESSVRIPSQSSSPVCALPPSSRQHHTTSPFRTLRGISLWREVFLGRALGPPKGFSPDNSTSSGYDGLTR